jgi:transposase
LKEVLQEVTECGLKNKVKSLLRANIYKQERNEHSSLPSHYIYTACEDASIRLKSFMKRKKQGKAYTDKPELKNVSVHLEMITYGSFH